MYFLFSSGDYYSGYYLIWQVMLKRGFGNKYRYRRANWTKREIRREKWV